MNKIYQRARFLYQTKTNRPFDNIQYPETPRAPSKEFLAKQNLIRIPELEPTLEFKDWQYEKKPKEININPFTGWQQEERRSKRILKLKSQNKEEKFSTTSKSRKIEKQQLNPEKQLFALSSISPNPPEYKSPYLINQTPQKQTEINSIMKQIMHTRQQQRLAPIIASNNDSNVQNNTRSTQRLLSQHTKRSLYLRYSPLKEMQKPQEENSNVLETTDYKNFPMRKPKFSIPRTFSHEYSTHREEFAIAQLRKTLSKLTSKPKYESRTRSRNTSRNIQRRVNQEEGLTGIKLI